MITKGYKRVIEKVKEIRQSFSKAENSGARIGNRAEFCHGEIPYPVNGPASAQCERRSFIYGTLWVY